MRLVIVSLFATLVLGCANPPTDTPKRIFETSQAFSGNLIAEAGDPTLDGPAAADLLCNRAATSGGLGGTWTAWISVGDGTNIGLDPTNPGFDLQGYNHAAYNIAAIDRIAGEGPWVNTDAQGSSAVFESRAALVAGDMSDILYDELGRPAGYFAWTGTTNGGQPTSNDCVGWSAEKLDTGAGSGSDDRGTAGVEIDSDDDVPGPTWTDDPNAALQDDPTCSLCPDPGFPAPKNPDAVGFGTLHCDDHVALYCFED